MKVFKPIDHLSDSDYYKKKRIKLILFIVVGVIFGYFIFYFSGKNLKHFIYIKSGISNFEKGKLSYAMSDFNKALNIKPNSPIALDGLGLIYVKQGDYEKAIKIYTEAIAAGLKSNSLINHVKYGNIYLDNGFYKKAELEFTQAIRLKNTDSKALFGLGCCYHAFGNLNQAINYYTKALTYNPKFTPARKNLSIAEEEKNKGAIYYLYDRNGEPLARYNLLSGENKKTYLLDFRTAHVIGFDSEKHGKYGIEKYLEQYLQGNKIYLTIDSHIQQTVAKIMGWYKGAIVILNPATGEILAIYSQPTFNPNNIDKDWNKIINNTNKPLINRAIEKLYEPGSIAKVLTISAFYENGLKENDVFPIRCGGSTMFSNKPFWCWDKHGKVKSIEQAIETSCNIASAYMGFSLGINVLSEFANRFGFNRDIDIGFYDPLRKEKISIPIYKSIFPTEVKDKFELAQVASGLTPSKQNPYLITPLHAAILAQIIANNGFYVNPYIIKEIRNINGKLIYKNTMSEPKRVISSTTAVKIKSLMERVVQEGIGKKAKVKGLIIAGKTGTSGGSKGLNAWFISFAPSDKPEYAMAILCDEEGKGMTIAAPIAAEIYKALLK
ncbi:MAG: penicillin-binding transpeptidase domain-containing protein [Candidatus Goldbacteria bacterium]|nr:penicillin-binding transpeptidase domain-containing protein [Candidatus Goldiibacteriota bacterium]